MNGVVFGHEDLSRLFACLCVGLQSPGWPRTTFVIRNKQYLKRRAGVNPRKGCHALRGETGGVEKGLSLSTLCIFLAKCSGCHLLSQATPTGCLSRVRASKRVSKAPRQALPALEVPGVRWCAIQVGPERAGVGSGTSLRACP